MLQIYLTLLGLAASAAAGGQSPRQVLEPSNATIELGPFKVGQVKESHLSIINRTSEDIAIARVMSTCGCLRPEIEPDSIPAEGSATLQVIAVRQFPGKFTYSIVVIPKDADKYDPLKIDVKGEAQSSVSYQVGWTRGILRSPTSAGACDLGIRHQMSADLIVRLTPVDKLTDTRGFVVDANSLHFGLHDITDSSGGHLRQQRDNIGSAFPLTLLFRPKKPLAIGQLRDLLEISLRDGSKLYVPLACRIVGDVYVQQEIIHLGKLKSCPTKNLDILFAGNVARWSNVQWNETGLLQQCLDIRRVDSDQPREVRIILSVDSTKLSALPKGYLFCRLTLYQHQPTDPEAVTVLVDGFNSEESSPLSGLN